jgi:hypothetical protein
MMLTIMSLNSFIRFLVLYFSVATVNGENLRPVSLTKFTSRRLNAREHISGAFSPRYEADLFYAQGNIFGLGLNLAAHIG